MGEHEVVELGQESRRRWYILIRQGLGRQVEQFAAVRSPDRLGPARRRIQPATARESSTILDARDAREG